MSNKVLIIIIAVFVLMIGIMGGGFFILWKQMSNTVAQVQQQSDEKAEPEKPPAEQEVSMGPIYKLDTMIVNLADQGGKRYLRITMDLELKPAENVDPKDTIDEVDKRLPQIRDTILMILPTKQYADIATTSGKIALRDEIMAKLNTILKKGQISNIYFTEFVVQ
jgi:flagellar protein FliL